jgi:hypothetical protein
MKSIRVILAILVLGFLGVFLATCSGGGGGQGGNDPVSGGAPSDTQSTQGNLALTQGESPSTYEIFNSYGCSIPNDQGNFVIPVSSTNPTFTFGVSKNGKRVYAALTPQAQSPLNLDAQSTAEALVLLNPLLIANRKEQFLGNLEVVKSNSDVRQLASVLERLYGSNEDPLSDPGLLGALTSAVMSVLNHGPRSNIESLLRNGKSRVTDAMTRSKETFQQLRSAVSTSPIRINSFDMGALTLDNSGNSVIRIDIAEAGPWGIETNIDWVAEIIELDPTKIQWINNDYIFNPDSLDHIIREGGFRKRVILTFAKVMERYI